MNEEYKILDITTVSESQLPSIISDQFDDLAKIEANIQKAVELAASAKERAQKAKVSPGWFKKKEAIELLQDAVNGAADASISSTEAQKLLFGYQTKLTEVTKYLFGLGVSNIAMNRSVVRELELKLKGASEEEISELAKQELRNVILQLKTQEDMMKKQEFLAKKSKEHELKIDDIDQQLDKIGQLDEKQDRKIEEIAKADQAQDDLISQNAEKIEEQDKRIEEVEQSDEEQNRRIDEMSKTDQEQDNLISQNAEKNDEQDNRISQNSEKNDEQDLTDVAHDKIMSALARATHDLRDSVKAQSEKMTLLHEKLEDLTSSTASKADQKMVLLSAAASAVALVLSIIQFFI